MPAYDFIPPDERELLITVGIALKTVQVTELAITTALTIAFHPASQMTLESLETENEVLRRSTLGRLLTVLRQRTEIHPTFEGTLQSFLEHRNRFCHSILVDPGHSMQTEDGRAQLSDFLRVLMDEGTAVLAVMLAAVRAFTDWLEGSTDGKFQANVTPSAALDRITPSCEELAVLLRPKGKT